MFGYPVYDEVKTAPWDYSRYDSTGEIPTFSKLFRADAYLEPTLEFARIARGRTSEEPLTILSIGCSFGVEIDSILAYYARTAPDIGRISIIGVDSSGDILDQAKLAKFHAFVFAEKGDDGEFSIKELEEFLPMFDFSIRSADHVSTFYDVDSSRLRGQHDVSFVHGNLAYENLDLPSADIIFCNNLLYHLDQKEADIMISGMAELLKPGGLLAIGTRKMDLVPQRAKIKYALQCRRFARGLRLDGIEPVICDAVFRAPFVFQRLAA